MVADPLSLDRLSLTEDADGALSLERLKMPPLQLVMPCPTCGRHWNTAPEGAGFVAEQAGPAAECCVALLIAETSKAR